MKTRLSLTFTSALVLLFFATPSTVRAHKLNTSYTNLIAEDAALKVRVRMDDFDLLKIGIDQDGDSLLFYEEMAAGLDDIFAFVEEQMRLRADGQPLTASFMDYALPRASDFPRFELDNTVTPTPVNPLGAKGVGEAGTIGSTPCIVAAAVDALSGFGVRHIDMLLRPEKLWRIIHGRA